MYCDADWSSCTTSRRSLSAYVAMVGDSAISWRTHKQDVVSHSSAEAEYRSMAEASREIKWLRRLLHDLGSPLKDPVRVYCDRKSAIYIATNPVFHDRTKLVESDYHQVRDSIKAGLLSTVHVRTNEQIADLLTKALGRVQFEKLLYLMGVRNFHLPKLSGSIG